MKIFNTGIIVGRFQHIHCGHEKIINIGTNLCEKLLIFVGSYNTKLSAKNPYDFEYRKKLIEDIYFEQVKNGSIVIFPLKDLKNKDELSPSWGKYVLKAAKEILGSYPNCIIYGKDKDIFKCFDKETVKNMSEILVDRKTLTISATKMRKFLLDDNKTEWKKYANSAIYNEYDKLREILLDVENKTNT